MALSKSFIFFSAIVAIQGAHVVEHIIQLIQVYILGIPDDVAFGLLGYVFQFQGTEEWLHLVFNLTFLLSLYALIPIIRRETPWPIPTSAFLLFLTTSVGLETWHVVEHIVIISNVLANNGCPCPGIVDSATGLTDTILHFVYNTIAYSGVGVAYWYAFQGRRRGASLKAKLA